MKKSEALKALAETLSIPALMKEYPELDKDTLRALLLEAARTVADADITGPRQEGFLFAAPAPHAIKSLRIFTDGASRGNPGEAGIGVVIEDASGKRIKEIRRYLGKTTNNQAEYSALLYGLKASRDMGAEDVSAFADSELLVKQMKGEYKVKHPLLQPLFAEAKSIVSSFKKFRITHVPRAQNAHADALANEAIDKKIRE